LKDKLPNNKSMDILDQALEFEQKKTSFKTTSERIEASREAKRLILAINELYKANKDTELMDLMKRLTVIKKKIEKRLKGRQAA
jgi:hypothetical protein